MPEPIDTLDDARVAPYRDLKSHDARSDCAADTFIVEGDALVRRLLASRLAVESLLVEDRLAARYADAERGGVAVFAAPLAVIKAVVGYDFHRGVLACGRRPANEPVRRAFADVDTLVVCPLIHDAENLGLIMRTAAALGAGGLLLGDRGVDPFSRRPLRVSMGAAFDLPIVRAADVAAELQTLRDEAGVALIATTLAPDATPLRDFRRPAPRITVLLGSEPDGLPADLVTLCDHRVTIPMHRGVDSLNVAVAAGIVLHALVHQG